MPGMDSYTFNLEFNADTARASQQITGLRKELENLLSISAKKMSIGEIDSTQMRQGTKAIIELNTHLQKSIGLDGQLDLRKLIRSLKDAGTSITEYGQKLNKLGPEGKAAFKSLTDSIIKAEVPIKRSSQLVEKFRNTLYNTFRWQVSSTFLNKFLGTFQKAYNYAQDLDKSLTNIKIVTGQSADQMAIFATQANKAAKELSTTTKAYTDASLIYYQQGLSDAEVKKRTETTIKLSNVTRQSAEQSSQQMTAIWNNFDDGTKSLESYADAITALGAKTASSSAEIATGLEKFAAISKTVGLSYEYSTAALATVTAQTRQSADIVGNAFKTLFGRMESLKLGETLEDGTDVNKYSEALQKVGVNVKDAAGGLRDMDTILDETGQKWKTLSKDQQVALAQTVGGVRQYAQFIALMDNYDIFKKNVSIARSSAGTLEEQQEILAEGWEAAQKRVTANAEELYTKLFRSDDFKNLENVFADLLDLTNKWVDSLGGLGGVLSTIGATMTALFKNRAISGINNWIDNTFINKKKILAFQEQAFDNERMLHAKGVTQAEEIVDERQRVLREGVLNPKLNDFQRQNLIEKIKIEEQLGEKWKESAKELQKAQTRSGNALYSLIPDNKINKVDINKDLDERVLDSVGYTRRSRVKDFEKDIKTKDLQTFVNNFGKMKKEDSYGFKNRGVESETGKKAIQSAIRQLEKNGVKDVFSSNKSVQEAFKYFEEGNLKIEETKQHIKNLEEVIKKTSKNSENAINKVVEAYQKEGLSAEQAKERAQHVLDAGQLSKTKAWDSIFNSSEVELNEKTEIQKRVNIVGENYKNYRRNVSKIYDVAMTENAESLNLSTKEGFNDFQEKYLKDIKANAITPFNQNLGDLIQKLQEGKIPLENVQTAFSSITKELMGEEEQGKATTAVIKQLTKVFKEFGLGAETLTDDLVRYTVNTLNKEVEKEGQEEQRRTVYDSNTKDTKEQITPKMRGSEIAMNAVQVGFFMSQASQAADSLGESFKTGADAADLVGQSIGALIPLVMSAIPLFASLGASVAGPIMAITAAVGALMFASKAIPSALDTAEMEVSNLTQASEQLSEFNQKLQDEYNDLQGQLDSFRDARKNIDNLVEGTQEWKDAVGELNQQYVELINKYPELVDYFEEVNGIKILSKENEEAFLEEQEAKVKTANRADMMTQVALKKANVEKEKALYSDRVHIETNGAADAYHTYKTIPILGDLANGFENIQEATNGIAGFLAGPITGAFLANSRNEGEYLNSVGPQLINNFVEVYKQQVGDFGKSTEDFWEYFTDFSDSKMKDAFEEYKKELLAMGEQAVEASKLEKEYADQIGTDYVAQYGTNDKYNNVLGYTIGEKIVAKQSDLEKEYSEKTIEDLETIIKSKFSDAVVENNEIIANGTRFTLDSAKKLAAQIMTEAQINGDETLKKQTEWMDKLYAEMPELSDDAAGLLVGKIDDISTISEESADYLKEHWENLDSKFRKDLQEGLGITFEVADNALEKIKEKDEEIMASLTEGAKDIYEELVNEGIIKKLNEVQKKKLAETLNQADVYGAKDVSNFISKVLKDNEENAVAFVETLRGIDWEQITPEELKTKFYDLGLEIEDLDKNKAQNLIESMRLLGSSFDTLSKKVADVNKIINSLKTGDSISSEDYGTLPDTLKQFFAIAWDGTYKLVGSAKELRDTAKQLWLAEYDKNISDNQNRANKKINYLDNYKDQGESYDKAEADVLKDYNKSLTNIKERKDKQDKYTDKSKEKEKNINNLKSLSELMKSDIHYDKEINDLKDGINKQRTDYSMHIFSGIKSDKPDETKYNKTLKELMDEKIKERDRIISERNNTNNSIDLKYEQNKVENYKTGSFNNNNQSYGYVELNDLGKDLKNVVNTLLKTNDDKLIADDRIKLEKYNERISKGEDIGREGIDYIIEASEKYGSSIENLTEDIQKYNEEALKDQWAVVTSAESFDELQDLKANGYNEEVIGAAAYNIHQQERYEELNEEEVENYANYLEDLAESEEDATLGSEKLSKELKGNSQVAKNLSTEVLRMNSGVDKLANNWEEWSSVLKKSTQGSKEYYDAAEGTKDAISDLLDVSTDYLSLDFIDSLAKTKDNMDLMAKAAKGDGDAIDELRQKAFDDALDHMDNYVSKDFLDNNGDIEKVKSKAQEIKNVLDENLKDKKLGVSLDASDFEQGSKKAINALNNMVEETGMSVDQYNNLISTMGFDVEFDNEMIEVERVGPQPTITHHTIENRATKSVGVPGEERQVETFDEVQVTEPYGDPIKTTDKIPASALATQPKGTKFAAKPPKIKKISKKAPGSANNYSPQNPGGKKTGKSGGSSSGAGTAVNKKEKPKKDKDPYWNINNAIKKTENQIEELNDTMSITQKVSDKLFGKALLTNLQAQNQQLELRNKLIKEERNNQEQLLKIQEKELTKKQKKLIEKAGGKFDVNGELTNYSKLYDKAFNELKEATDKYNNAQKTYKSAKAKNKEQDAIQDIKDSKGSKKEKSHKQTNLKSANKQASKDAEKAYEMAQKDYEEKLKLLEEWRQLYYTEIAQARATLRKLREEELSNIIQKLENKQREREIKLQLKLDTSQAEKTWKEYLNKVNKEFKKQFEDFTIAPKNIETNVNLLSSDIQNTIKEMNYVKGEIDKLSQIGGKSNAFYSISEAQERLRQLTNDLISKANELEDLQQEIYSNYINNIDDYSSRLSDINNMYQDINDKLEYNKQLTDLIYGDKAYNKMHNYYENQKQVYKDQLATIQNNRDNLQKQFNQALLNNGANKNDRLTWTQDMYKLDEMIQQEDKKIRDITVKNAQLLKEEYSSNIKEISASLEKNIFGKTLEFIKADWEYLINKSNEYYDGVEASYQLQAYINKINQEIEKSSSLSTQQKLKKLRDDELKFLKQKDQLTKKDVELLNARYQIRLKEIELENAQNQKNSMKLVRDTNGNWTYQYVADPEAEAQAKQALLDANYDYYELSKSGAQDSINKLLENILSYQQEINSLENIGLDDDERKLRIKELSKRFGEDAKDALLHFVEYYSEAGYGAAGVGKLLDENAEEFKQLPEALKTFISTINKDESFADLRQSLMSGDIETVKQFLSNSFTLSGDVIEKLLGLNAEKIEKIIVKSGNTTATTINQYQQAIREAIKDTDLNTNLSDIQTETANISQQNKKYYSRFNSTLTTISDILGRVETIVKQNRDNIKSEYDSTAPIITADATTSNYKTGYGFTKQAYRNDTTLFANAVMNGNLVGDSLKDIVKKLKPSEYGDFIKAFTDEAKRKDFTQLLVGQVLDNEIGTGDTYDDLKLMYNSLSTKAMKQYFIEGLINKPKKLKEFFKNLEDRSDIKSFLTIMSNNYYPELKTLYNSVDNEFQKIIWQFLTKVAEQKEKELKNDGFTKPSDYKDNIKYFDTGGYTGDWDSTGRLAVLHQKELVLNQKDTANMLEAVNAVRDIAKINSSIENSIYGGLKEVMMKIVAGGSSSILNGMRATSTEPAVEHHFNITAEFPNANDVSTIQQAILTLPNLATQYIHQR